MTTIIDVLLNVIEFAWLVWLTSEVARMRAAREADRDHDSE